MKPVVRRIIEYFNSKGFHVTYEKSKSSDSYYMVVHDQITIRVSDHRGKGRHKHKYNVLSINNRQKVYNKGRYHYSIDGLPIMFRDIEQELTK